MSPNSREVIGAISTITNKQEYLTSTNGALNINGSFNLSGQAIPASGLTTAVAVQIVDGSGNQISSFGGGTQYAEGATDSPGTGTLAIGRYNLTPPTLSDTELFGLQLDSSGNLKVSGAGGGTQYTDGNSDTSPATGPTVMYDNDGNWQHVSKDDPLPVFVPDAVELSVSVTDGDIDSPAGGLVAFGQDASDVLHPLQLDPSGNLLVNIATGGGSGGTSSSFASAFPSTGTAIGATDGTNMQPLKVDGSDNLLTKINAALPSGTNVIGHVITDSGSTTAVTGTVTISGTVTANAGTNLNTSLLALESGGNLAAIKTDTDKIPSLGQALAASSVPVVLTALQLTALTPPAAITNYALETGGNLATIAGTVTSAVLQTNEKQINGVVPLMGNGVTGTGSQRVTIASDNTAFSVNATLSAETTKVIGVTRTADGSGNLLTSTANALDINIKSGSIANTSFAVTQGTAANLNATVVGTGTFSVQNTAATPAGTNLIGKVGIDQTTVGTTNAVSIAQIGANTVLTGNGTAGTGAQRVTIASDNTAFSVNATLSAETTKVIGTVNQGTSPWVVNDPGLPDTLGQKTESGSTSVVIASDQSAIPVSLSPGGNAWKTFFANAITTTQTVSGSAGEFGGYALINTNSVPAYLQFFDTTGAVTLGSTTPTFVIPLPANSTPANGVGANFELGAGSALANGLKVAATTTPTGASTVATGISGTIWYF